mmetsp:Transcript_40606/g.87166  ORF Transcript_40606/g.87166 Transcript_40606/m.87166 type:complete len:97 (+) Transcript_40606:820-1110(+)
MLPGSVVIAWKCVNHVRQSTNWYNPNTTRPPSVNGRRGHLGLEDQNQDATTYRTTTASANSIKTHVTSDNPAPRLSKTIQKPSIFLTAMDLAMWTD